MAEEGMRLKDYIDRLEPEEYEEIFTNMEEEEKRLREFLSLFPEPCLAYLTNEMDDPYVYDGQSDIDYLIDLYKCGRADYSYDNAEDAIDDIKRIVKEEEAFFEDYMDLGTVYNA